MQKKYKGFTITELLVVMAFISFIVIHEIIIINQKVNNYGALYYNAYNSLRKVAYNIFVDTNSTNGQRRPFPDDSQAFCERLAEWFNIPGNKNYCKTCDYVDDEAKNLIVTYDKTGKTKETSKTLAFKTSNGSSFYIGKNLHTYKFSSYDEFEEEDKDYQVKYFIVYIDINGNKKPNRLDVDGGLSDKADKILPDVVPFAVTTTGNVIPLGYPAYRKEYLTAKIKLPSNGDGEEAGTKEMFAKAMTFNESIHTAWNGREDKEVPFSLLINEKSAKSGGFSDDNIAKKFYKGKVPTISPDSDDYKIHDNNYKLNGYQYKFDNDDCCKIEDDIENCYDVVFDCKVIVEESNKSR